MAWLIFIITSFCEGFVSISSIDYDWLNMMDADRGIYDDNFKPAEW